MNIITNMLISAVIICLLFAFVTPFLRAKFGGSLVKRSNWELNCKKYVWFLCFFAFIRQFIGEQFIIPSESMLPNLGVGDYI